MRAATYLGLLVQAPPLRHAVEALEKNVQYVNERIDQTEGEVPRMIELSEQRSKRPRPAVFTSRR